MRKSQLNNLAAGLCSTFISRNNDIAGYWGPGSIYQFAKENDVSVVVFDLMGMTVTPQTKKFESVLHQYALWLKNRSTQTCDEVDIQSASVSVAFNVPTPNTGKIYRQTYGDLFMVQVCISDRSGKTATANNFGHCAPRGL